MDIPTDQAKEILDAYFASFPNVRSFMESTVKEARARGYTTTLMGRRRLLPELASDNFRIRQMGERMAQNAPVQGGAADIFKLAMVNLDAELEERAMRSRMVLTVHDEVVLEVPLEEHDSRRRAGARRDGVGVVRSTSRSRWRSPPAPPGPTPKGDRGGDRGPPHVRDVENQLRLPRWRHPSSTPRAPIATGSVSGKE